MLSFEIFLVLAKNVLMSYCITALFDLGLFLLKLNLNHLWSVFAIYTPLKHQKDYGEFRCEDAGL